MIPMMSIATGALVLAAIYMRLKNRRPHEQGPAHLRKLQAKLRAQYRRKLRSPKLRGDAKARRIYRRLLNMPHAPKTS